MGSKPAVERSPWRWRPRGSRLTASRDPVDVAPGHGLNRAALSTECALAPAQQEVHVQYDPRGARCAPISAHGTCPGAAKIADDETRIPTTVSKKCARCAAMETLTFSAILF